MVKISNCKEKCLGRLVEINKKYADEYVSSAIRRSEYIRNHPTDIRVFKCMDGRVHFPVLTGIPIGALTNYRNLGGQFDFGWPMLNFVVRESVKKSFESGRQCLFIITYHYSESDGHLGCAGHGYNKRASVKHAYDLKGQIERAFGNYRSIYKLECIVMGIETDRESFVLHGKNQGDNLNTISISPDESKENVFSLVREKYSDLTERMLLDLLPLVMGNITHANRLMQEGKSAKNNEHREWILGVGSTGAFNWLHEPNTALLVGQYNPNLSRPIRKAAGLIKANLESGKICNNTPLLLAAADYENSSVEPQSVERAKYSYRLAREVIEEFYPELIEFLCEAVVIVDRETQLFKLIK